MKDHIKKILLTTFLFALIVGCSEKKSTSEYIVEAESALTSGEHKSAIIALKNGIQADPQHAEARFLLGQLYLSLDNNVNAIKELERAKNHQYSDAKVLPLLANAYYLNEDFQSLIDLDASTLTAVQAMQVKYYQSLAYIQLQQLDKSKALLHQISSVKNAEGYHLLIQAYIAFHEQALEKAKQSVQAALSLLPAQPQGLLLLGHIGSASNNFKMAAEHYKKYLNVQPNQRSVELMLANALLQDGKMKQAEIHADNILALAPNQAFANYVKAMVNIQSSNYEKANKHAELAINNKFNQPNIKLVAGISAFYLKKHEQVLFYLKPLLAYLPEDHFGRKMVIVSQMELGLIEDAADTVDSLAIAADNNSQFYSAISYRLLQAGAIDEAKSIMAKQGQSDTQDAKQLLNDGVLRMMLNDNLALKSLEKAITLDPELVKAELALAFLAVKSGDINKAQKIADKWQTNYPNRAESYQLAAAIAAQQKDLPLAEQLLQKSLTVEPNNVISLIQLTQLALHNKHLEKAKSSIAKAVTLNPYHVQALRLYFDINKGDKALNIIAEKAQSAPDNQEIKLVHAEALLKLNKVDEAIKILHDIPANAEAPKRYWLLNVVAAKASKNRIMLKSTLDKWQELNPFHLEHSVYLAQYYVAEKNPEKALKTINLGLEKHKEHLTLSLVKIQLLLDMKKIKEAEIAYQTIRNKVVGQNAQFGIEGRLALLNNAFESAVEKLTLFYQNQPTVINAMYLSAALVENKQKASAIKLLETHIAKFEAQPQLYSALGSLQLSVGNKTQALKTYEKMANEVPNSVIAINNTAWLYMEIGQLDNALAYAEKAVAIAPNIANVIDTYSQILLKSGNNREALTHAKKAYELSKGKNIDITLNYAALLLANKRKNQALQILTDLSGGNEAQKTRKYSLLAQINS